MHSKNEKIAKVKSKLDKVAGKTSFVIQGAHVAPVYTKQKEFRTIGEIFPVLFPVNTEAAYLFWNKIPVRFHYNYEAYANWEAIIDWLFVMSQNKVEGQHNLILKTDQLFAEITSEWKAGHLIVESHWQDRHAKTGMADVLNKKSKLSLPINDFVKEWAIILLQMAKIIKQSGISFTSELAQRRLKGMYATANSVDGLGKLYMK